MMQRNWPPALIANRYRLLDSIGAGGFGEVFRAEDLKFDPPRVVALKMLHSNLLHDAQVCADLKREAGILASFNHPNILRVLDFEVRPDLAYIVTELAAGGSLEHKLYPNGNNFPPTVLPLAQVAQYLEQISRGLDEIHAKGQVHRDLKPANILLDESGRALLADFGVALTLSNAGSSRLVTAMVAWGTAEYAAPEVWDDKVGKASDIYALGVLTYQMLTGATPYQGSAPALMKQHLEGKVPPLRKYAPQLNYPASLDVVLAKAMAVEANARYRKAGDFYAAFKEALASTDRPVSLLGSFLQALTTPPSSSPASPSSPVTQPASPRPLSPQEVARQHLAQQLDYLNELFAKAEQWSEWDSAIEIGKLILSLDKANQLIIDRTTRAYRLRAFDFLRKREYRHAFGDLMAAIKLDPTASKGGFKRFVTVSYDFVVAMNAVFKALQPIYPPESNNLAAGQVGSKVTYDFNRAIALEPYRSEHYFERGRYYFDNQDYERAIRDFSRAIELESDNFLKTCYFRERGQAFERKGNRRAAHRDFREADKYLRLATSF